MSVCASNYSTGCLFKPSTRAGTITYLTISNSSETPTGSLAAAHSRDCGFLAPDWTLTLIDSPIPASSGQENTFFRPDLFQDYILAASRIHAMGRAKFEQTQWGNNGH